MFIFMTIIHTNKIARTSRRKASVNSHGEDKALPRGSRENQHSLFSISRSFFIFGLILFICGGFYIHEINMLATKGYEIRELENKIKELTQESRQLKIREVELRSMYAIEKSMKNMNLVGLSNVSYIEMEGPVAMK